MNYHNRHDYMKKTGKRISKGAWERLNTAYDVHKALDREGREKFRIVGRDDEGKPMVTLSTTNVLKPETTKANRKVSLRDKYGVRTKRARYAGKPIGETR
jgi:hypothetical protein